MSSGRQVLCIQNVRILSSSHENSMPWLSGMLVRYINPRSRAASLSANSTSTTGAPGASTNVILPVGIGRFPVGSAGQRAALGATGAAWKGTVQADAAVLLAVAAGAESLVFGVSALDDGAAGSSVRLQAQLNDRATEHRPRSSGARRSMARVLAVLWPDDHGRRARGPGKLADAGYLKPRMVGYRTAFGVVCAALLLASAAGCGGT